PSEALRAEFEALLPPFAASEVVHQCGSGITACHAACLVDAAGPEKGRCAASRANCGAASAFSCRSLDHFDLSHT
ncbi:MAG: hypothetical protein ACM3KD_13290, partial [Hyphomicrobiaceae bacterium]